MGHKEEEEPSNEVDLNEMFGYEPISEDEVWIHISDVRELSLSEKLKLLKDGLRDLAGLLQTNPDLSQIKKISGMSWIVSKNPKLVESLGFTIAKSLEGLEDQVREYEDRKEAREIHSGDTPGYAYISTKNLLNFMVNLP